jgi:quaternary ammonium compound-resistance protein SugE
MHWTLLIIAGLFEVAFAFCLGKAKLVTGTAQLVWLGGFLICLGISMFLLYKATQVIPLGTGYAVWTGIGAVGTVILGLLFFREPVTFWRIFFIFTLIVSIIGLKVASN